MIAGILAFIGVLLLVGLALPESRSYIVDGVKLLLGSIPAVSALR